MHSEVKRLYQVDDDPPLKPCATIGPFVVRCSDDSEFEDDIAEHATADELFRGAIAFGLGRERMERVVAALRSVMQQNVNATDAAAQAAIGAIFDAEPLPDDIRLFRGTVACRYANRDSGGELFGAERKLWFTDEQSTAEMYARMARCTVGAPTYRGPTFVQPGYVDKMQQVVLEYDVGRLSQLGQFRADPDDMSTKLSTLSELSGDFIWWVLGVESAAKQRDDVVGITHATFTLDNPLSFDEDYDETGELISRHAIEYNAVVWQPHHTTQPRDMLAAIKTITPLRGNEIAVAIAGDDDNARIDRVETLMRTLVRTAEAGATTTAALYSLLCWNVQGYNAATAESVARFIAAQNADIVCLQEDIADVDIELERYITVAACRGEPVPASWVRRARTGSLESDDNDDDDADDDDDDDDDDSFLANTIIVKTELQKIAIGDNVGIGEACTTERCAAVLHLRGLVIANVHLCGGRSDDKDFRSLANEKANEIAKVVERFAPHLIVGDFNGERNRIEAETTLRDYPAYRDLSVVEREQFMTYYLSAHRWLTAHGYEPAFTEAAVRPTSAFGGVPDWVYVRRDSGIVVQSVRRIDAIPELSDHNALLVNFAVATPQQ